MDADFVSKAAGSAERRKHCSSSPHTMSSIAALRLTRRALWVLALLLSLTLWAGLWTAIASLASGMLG